MMEGDLIQDQIIKCSRENCKNNFSKKDPILQIVCQNTSHRCCPSCILKLQPSRQGDVKCPVCSKNYQIPCNEVLKVLGKVWKLQDMLLQKCAKLESDQLELNSIRLYLKKREVDLGVRLQLPEAQKYHINWDFRSHQASTKYTKSQKKLTSNNTASLQCVSHEPLPRTSKYYFQFNIQYPSSYEKQTTIYFGILGRDRIGNKSFSPQPESVSYLSYIKLNTERYGKIFMEEETFKEGLTARKEELFVDKNVRVEIDMNCQIITWKNSCFKKEVMMKLPKSLLKQEFYAFVEIRAKECSLEMI